MTGSRWLLVGLAAAPLIAGCGGDAPRGAGDGKLGVAASIFPLADVARRVGGEDVEVVTLLPAGTLPHGFEPQPRQVEELARCRLLLTVGRGMDPWAERAARATGRSIRVVEMAGAVGQEEHHEEGEREHGHAEGDPHLWLDPAQMKVFVSAVAAELAGLDPSHKADYERRAAAFIAELDTLDAEYREALGKVKVRAFVSFHPAFTHLAKRYGLKQVALMDSHADEGGPMLERVVAFVREHKLRVIFAEPQFPAEKLRWLEEQTGAKVGRLDPIGSPDVPGYDSYLAMMRSNLRALAAAMSEE